MTIHFSFVKKIEARTLM